MNMRVIEELLGPGVENSQHADGAPDEPAITGQLDDGLGGRLHEHTVAVPLV
jgi:hypothetical protein